MVVILTVIKEIYNINSVIIFIIDKYYSKILKFGKVIAQIDLIDLICLINEIMCITH